MSAPGRDAMAGEIAEGVLPELLRTLYVGRRSGLMRLRRGDEEQSLRFRHGTIVNSQTNVVEDRLGEMLVRRGLLKQPDLVRATEIVMREKRRLGAVLSDLGLIDTNGLEDAIAFHVHEMIARLFAWPDGSYAFESETEEASTPEITLKLSTGELILEAVRAVKDPDVVRYALGDIDRLLQPSSDPLLRFQKLTLSPTDGFALSRVDGSSTAREILQMIPLPVEETQLSLFGLLSTGVIEYGAKRKREAAPHSAPAVAAAAAAPPPAPPAAQAPPPPPPPPAPPAAAAPPPPPAQPAPAVAAAPAVPDAPLDAKAAERRKEILDAWEGLATRNHFELLGLTRSVGEAEVKDAYFRLAKRFHPDVHHGASLGDLRDKLEAVFIKLGEAYDTLRDKGRRGDYEARLGRARPQAAGATASSPEAPGGRPPSGAYEPLPRDPEEEARVTEETLRKAARLLEQAKALEQEKPGDNQHQRLIFDAIQLLEPLLPGLQGKTRLRAQLHLARAYMKNPKWLKRAEEMLIEASRDNPQSAEAYSALGSIYHVRGMRSRALSMYKKVLELKPDHEEAFKFVAENTTGDDLPQEPEGGGGGLLGRLFRKG